MRWSTLSGLTRNCDDALARIAELEQALFRPDFRIPPEWKLTRQETTLLGALIAAGDAVLTRAAMMAALYGSEDWAGPKIVDVLMSKMRTKLKPHGIAVETVWGRGYRLSSQARERISTISSPKDAIIREASALYWNGRISRDGSRRHEQRCACILSHVGRMSGDALYYRTSSAANVEGDSEARRRAAVSAYAERVGLTVVAEFYDAAVSGADPVDLRRGFRALLVALRERGVRKARRR